uniref:Uncharacterized protein n=1 Tax=Pakpunavirus sp. TaxID=2833053 RepID=A0AB39BZF6_9CAUD
MARHHAPIKHHAVRRQALPILASSNTAHLIPGLLAIGYAPHAAHCAT